MQTGLQSGMALLFEPDELQSIARAHVGTGRPLEETFERLIADLAGRYPGHIRTTQDWVFNLAAGATGMMTILHGSLSEYLILFGSAIGTEAFSGRYLLDIWDCVLTGEMWTYTEETFSERLISRPGDMALLRRGQAKGYRIEHGTWMLEYGRGPIATALPVGLGGAIFLGMDPKTIAKTLWLYGRAVAGELVKGKI